MERVACRIFIQGVHNKYTVSVLNCRDRVKHLSSTDPRSKDQNMIVD
jgi:hypothetical protein